MKKLKQIFEKILMGYLSEHKALINAGNSNTSSEYHEKMFSYYEAIPKDKQNDIVFIVISHTCFYLCDGTFFDELDINNYSEHLDLIANSYEEIKSVYEYNPDSYIEGLDWSSEDIKILEEYSIFE